MILESPKSRSQESRVKTWICLSFPKIPPTLLQVCHYQLWFSTVYHEKFTFMGREKEREGNLCFSNSWHCLQSAALPSLSMFCKQVSLPQLMGPGSCSSCVPVCVLCVGSALRKRNSTCFSKKPQKCPWDLSVVPIRPVRNCDGAMKFKSPSLSRRLSWISKISSLLWIPLRHPPSVLYPPQPLLSCFPFLSLSLGIKVLCETLKLNFFTIHFNLHGYSQESLSFLPTCSLPRSWHLPQNSYPLIWGGNQPPTNFLKRLRNPGSGPTRSKHKLWFITLYFYKPFIFFYINSISTLIPYSSKVLEI